MASPALNTSVNTQPAGNYPIIKKPISADEIKKMQTPLLPGADLSKFAQELPSIIGYFSNLADLQGLNFLINGQAVKWKDLHKPLLEITRNPSETAAILYALAVKEKNAPNHQNQIVLENVVSKGKNPATQQELAGRIAKAIKTKNPGELIAPPKLPPTADQLIGLTPNSFKQGISKISPEEESVVEFEVDEKWLCEAVLGGGYISRGIIKEAYASKAGVEA